MNVMLSLAVVVSVCISACVSQPIKLPADVDIMQTESGLHRAVRDKLQSRTPGQGDLLFTFQDAVEFNIKSGEGEYCKQQGFSFMLESGGSCNFSVKFGNGASCPNVKVDMMVGGLWEYYKVGHSGDTNCMNIISGTGSRMAGTAWPCQNDGCYSAPTGKLIFAAGAPPATAETIDVKATLSWEPTSPYAGEYKTETTRGSTSGSSSSSSTSYSVSATVGYGPVSGSVSADTASTSAAEAALSQSSSTTATITVPACDGGRWRQIWTYTSIATGTVVSTVKTQFTVCSEGNKIPKCRYESCVIPNCQECNN